MKSRTEIQDLQRKVSNVENKVQQVHVNLTKKLEAALKQVSIREKNEMDDLYKNLTDTIKKSEVSNLFNFFLNIIYEKLMKGISNFLPF